ncbi:Transcriptional regulatory protein AfsQ1 [Thermoflexales bacterium]|jgi:DNA-binding response OmpR family regulator|nr:Transcriptional regulatory protein AfsQ1 [Thermoflexales bacterium]
MSQPSILVVDDELETVELIRAAFKRRRCNVIGALNGRDGLRLAREHRPAIILIDLMLPGISGFELCRHLRADPITAHIPQVILSARESPVDQAEALAAGADRYLVKPVGIKILVSMVEGLIDQHHLRDCLA